MPGTAAWIADLYEKETPLDAGENVHPWRPYADSQGRAGTPPRSGQQHEYVPIPTRKH